MLLLRHGAKVTARDGHGVTPLGIAAEYGNTEALDILIQHGKTLLWCFTSCHVCVLSSWVKHFFPHSSDLVAFSLRSTRWWRECSGQQWRHGPVWCSWIWKPGLCRAAPTARSQPECSQLRLPAAHPQSCIWGTHTVSWPSCLQAVWQCKRAPSHPGALNVPIIHAKSLKGSDF